MIEKGMSVKSIILHFTISCLILGSLLSVPADRRSFAQKAGREVAITFDDLPATSSDEQISEIINKLVATISKHKIPAVGFVNEGKLYGRGKLMTERVTILQKWLDAGLELGNHTYSHIQIDRASIAEYKEDVIRGETVTKRLLQAKGMKLRYFRHPQLRTGPTPAYEKELNQFLADRSYTVAPVTIDSQEWIYAEAYASALARKDQENVERIAGEYLKYMEQCFGFFEGLSHEFLGYEVKQTLLVHANQLNADHFDALVEMMKRRGYRFITLEDALKDQAYGLPTASSGRGDSWIHRWMLAKGLKMRPEPREPEWLTRLIESYARR
jgi:peptidoglycan/xylan/chitin deacetylase (PgdA/CDA1 family)